MNQKKSIYKNSLFNVIYKTLNAFFPLISTSYVSLALLAEGVGKVSYSSSIVTLFITIASLGIPNYGIKVIAQSANNREKRNLVFSELMIINGISTLICVLGYFSMVNGITYFENEKTLYNVMGIMLILNFINVDWFYQGNEDYVYIAIRSILIKIFSILALILFVKDQNDYVIYALILCLATTGNNVFNIVHLKRYVNFTLTNLKIKQHLKPVIILLAASMATNVYTILDTTMLGWLKGDIYVGYYSNATKIIRMIFTLVIALVATFYPRISLYYSKKEYGKLNRLLDQGVSIVLLLAVPSSLGLFLMADRVVLVLFGESFWSSVATVRILSVLIIVFSIAYLLGHVVLLSVNKESRILRATIVGAIINFVFNIILIPRFNQNGAAVASLISEVVVTVILLMSAKKFFSLTLDMKFIISEFISLVVMSMALLVTRNFTNIDMIGLFICIAIGGMIYVFSMVLFKNRLACQMIELFRVKYIHLKEKRTEG